MEKKYRILVTISVLSFISKTYSQMEVPDPVENDFLLSDIETQRVKRQTTEDSVPTSSTSSNCSFPLPNTTQSTCPFILNSTQFGLFSWKVGIGKNSIWIGGPTSDADGHTEKSGYMLAHMKQSIHENKSAIMLTDAMSHTKSKGKCLSFKYATEGLSLKQFDIVILINFTSCKDNNSSGENCKNNTTGSTYSSISLWTTTDTTYGNWKTKNITFSYHDQYRLAFIAIPERKFSDYSSYVAVDNIQLTTGPCGNDCQFDQNFCQWKILTNKTDFEWKISRSSTNYGYGPSRDQSSSIHPNILAGGFAYIENAYPRRAGDKARIISSPIAYSEMPTCMRFWAFMTGKDVATLKIIKQNDSGALTEIWNKSPKEGDYGWGPCQITLSDSSTTSLKVIIEAEINQLSDGEIAIDSITFEEGSCPVEPAIAGNRMSNLDCSFEVNSCFWRWIQPKMRSKTTSTPMLTKVSGNNGRLNGHSWNPLKSGDSYIMFELGSYVHHARDSAYLVSPTLLGRNNEYCLSFWGLMNTGVGTDRSVGSLSVIMALSEENNTLWRLSNRQYSNWFRVHVPVKANQPFQILIKGTKGCKRSGNIAIDDISFYPHKCSPQPKEAEVFPLDCSFDDDSCNWKLEHLTNNRHNITDGWRYPGEHFGLTAIYDHTYEISNGGFVYVYLKSTKQEYLTWLVSPFIKSNTTKCLTFYVNPLSIDDKATLTVYRRNTSNVLTRLWNVSKQALPSEMFGNAQDKWLYAQCQFIGSNSQIVIEAKMETGGWAIDDIRVLAGTCETRPTLATVTNHTEFAQIYKTKQAIVPTTSKTKMKRDMAAKIRITKSPTPSALLLDDGYKMKNTALLKAKSDHKKRMKLNENSVLLPPTELDSPNFPRFEKTGFLIPVRKKNAMG